MRTGPFSDTRVIERLNACFVPVYAVNEDYRARGSMPQAERGEYERIYRQSLAAGFSTGTVHVYICGPDGKPFGTLHVAHAGVKNLLPLLDRAVKHYHVTAGKPLVPPTCQSVAPPAEKGGLVLHLTARPLKSGGSWDGISEDWITYTPNEIRRLLPEGAPRPGQTWMPDAKLIARLLAHVYPVTENNDVSRNRIDEQVFTARVLSNEGGVVRARLTGRLRMKHTFYYKEDGNEVKATLAGYLEFEPATGKVRAFRLATEAAAYGGGTFGVVVRSFP
jgi:hypothetical protein